MSYARSQRHKALRRDRAGYIARARQVRIQRLATKLFPLYGDQAIPVATAVVMKTRPGGESHGQ